jgi:hypothetical protein
MPEISMSPKPFLLLKAIFLYSGSCLHSRTQHYPRYMYIRRIKNEHSF